MTLNIQEQKKKLEQRRAEIQNNAASLTEAYPTPVSTEEISEGSQEFEEIAVDFLETQQEQSLLVNDQALLSEINTALKRIEDGTYGKCIECGKVIPEKRLEALPWALRCIEDEEKLEKVNLGQQELYDSDIN
ncbi:TraR/DksA family transcriptional regulator [Tengunoibacter tsumagoiensis]|uniref:Conjugal transfer protein TraR n=1 Tax=Tengunoibacter tsumagoiensis TaxID=2014871 RepID=A0A402A1R5_9CHLR|nr:TraR/DksA family transcriptional regulator [Tengunoibacter tsumagoiensis]GCE12941.1 conjugal transfer protein TraR [Tengunoibacter tsumagoiensis]